MNIAMFTNTYLPQVGGVAESVARFTDAARRAGHRVLVVAPEYEEMPENEEDVMRVPAVENFNGSEFSLAIPPAADTSGRLAEFSPDLIHSHHPFLLGDTALRLASFIGCPLIYTHHTMYEYYTHYVPVDSGRIEDFVIELCTGYENLCSRVIAPSSSIAHILHERGVETPITVLPTGVNTANYKSGNGEAFRKQMEIPADAVVIGHVGRLAPEKNLPFLARSLSDYLQKNEEAYFLVVGDGESAEHIEEIFSTDGLRERLVMAGVRKGEELINAYHAMNIFAFASTTETQGMVLVEALASGSPVVALKAPGVNDVIEDGYNGITVATADREQFAEALAKLAGMLGSDREKLTHQARKSAENFDISQCSHRLLEVYQEVKQDNSPPSEEKHDNFDRLQDRLSIEWQLWKNRAAALAEAINGEDL